jgi:Ca2+-transporting ATPase
LLNPKSYAAFHALRGVAGLEKGLRTSIQSGLSLDEDELSGKISFEDVTGISVPSKSLKDLTLTRTQTHGSKKSGSASKFHDRKRVFGDNRIPERKSKSFLELAWIAMHDKVLILLSIAAVVSLGLGLYQTFGDTKEEGAHVEWIEGVAIIVAICIVVFVGALNDWQKERQFAKLNKQKEDRDVKVIRSGRTVKISVYDVLVGDVMILEQGDMIPADGIFISGHNVSCDESSATGESDLLKKTAAVEVFRAQETREDTRKMDPFIISGSKVAEGVGSYLVTAVGIHSTNGKTMMSLREDNQVTPLQLKLNVLAGKLLFLTWCE